jgi:antitoxin PrlF
MAIAHSRITSQGQISVPAGVRKRLGVGPGAVLEWDDANGEIVVRRAGRYTSAEVHAALFPGAAPQPKSAEEIKDGVRTRLRKRHAGR